MFNEFFFQNKFIIEKHIKFVIETETHKIYWIKTKTNARMHIEKKIL
jgi:hypothetical protein